MTVNCTSPTSTTVSGECQLMVITRTWSGCRPSQRPANSTSSRCHWRHVVSSWRPGLAVYANTARPTDNCCVSLSCRSSWMDCHTAMKQHAARLSFVTEARHRSTGSGLWVKCFDLSYHTINYSNIKILVGLMIMIMMIGYTGDVRIVSQWLCD